MDKQISVVTTHEQFQKLARILWDKASVEVELIPKKQGGFDLFVNYANSEYYKEVR